MTVPSDAEVGGAQDEADDQRGPARPVAGAGAPRPVSPWNQVLVSWLAFTFMSRSRNLAGSSR